jgi:hypothetical protein
MGGVQICEGISNWMKNFLHRFGEGEGVPSPNPWRMTSFGEKNSLHGFGEGEGGVGREGRDGRDTILRP